MLSLVKNQNTTNNYPDLILVSGETALLCFLIKHPDSVVSFLSNSVPTFPLLLFKQLLEQNDVV